MKTKLLLIAILAMLINTASAQSDMNYFVGHWKFEGWMGSNTSDTPDFTAHWTVQNGLANATALTGYVTLDSGTNTRELIAWNPAAREYVRTISSNDGNYFVFTSKGWEGSKLTWTGNRYSPTETVQMKEEITKINEREFKAQFYTHDLVEWLLVSTERLIKN